jgi:hypothetical protein
MTGHKPPSRLDDYRQEGVPAAAMTAAVTGSSLRLKREASSTGWPPLVGRAHQHPPQELAQERLCNLVNHER